MESKRIKALKKDIIRELPVFPNNKATKKDLESKRFDDLLIDYLSWKVRFVTPRKRKVIINSNIYLAEDEISFLLNTPTYSNFKSKVELGDDLNPYLSFKAHTKGYSPVAKEQGSSWIDKDFILNVMNFYHFHLLPYETNKQESTRTNELIFAKVDKTTFEIVGIFNHLIFEYDADTQKMTSERKKLWKRWENVISENFPEGSIIKASNITSSGHSQNVVSVAFKYSELIEEYDKKLDDILFLKTLYDKLPIPDNPKLKFYFRGTDLGVYDRINNSFILEHGKN